MSNCIDFHSGTQRVTINRDDIDADALMAEIDSHLGHRGWSDPNHPTNEEPNNDQLRCEVVQWFINASNLTVWNDRIEIRLGEARSGHTWRDFKQTLWFISRFISREIHLIFIIEDEGFPGKMPALVTLVPGGWPKWTSDGRTM